MKKILEIERKREANEKFFSIVNNYISLNDYQGVRMAINGVGEIVKDTGLINRIGNLFMKDVRAVDFFGLGANIVNTMINTIFSSNFKIKIEHDIGEELVNKLYYDGMFIDTMKEAYRVALSSICGRSYILFNIDNVYDTRNDIKVGEKFIDFKVLKPYEVDRDNNVLVYTFYKDVNFGAETKIYTFKYKYITDNDDSTLLWVYGYDEKDNEISSELVMDILGIQTVEEKFSFKPYQELNLGKGSLPNMLFIEDNLAQALYFQNLDLSSSQTHNYAPEAMLNAVPDGVDIEKSYYDRYQLNHVVKNTLSGAKLESIAGESAIGDIERNIALNVLRGSLDAEISPLSLGYSLIDKIASNTDIGAFKERVTIRKREADIVKLKIVMGKTLQNYFKLMGIDVNYSDIAIIFNPYITPSVESMVNTLSKAVQFGIMSRERAVMLLQKDELNDEEMEIEMENIRAMVTQQDFNVSQQLKGENNVLKGEQIKD